MRKNFENNNFKFKKSIEIAQQLKKFKYWMKENFKAVWLMARHDINCVINSDFFDNRSKSKLLNYK